MDQTQNDQPEKCSRCNEFPEDILMLACSHDLCLLCAATIFTALENSIPRSNNTLRCEQCGSLTQLDQSSILELEKLLPQTRLNQSQQLKMPTSTPSHGQTPQRSTMGVSGNQKNEILMNFRVYEPYLPQQPLMTSMPSQSRYQERLPLGNSMMGSASKKQKQFCPNHPEEKISYFCYDCESNCICPECVIHGVHKNHDVGTVKKAYPLIMRKLEERIDEVNAKIKEVKSYQDKFNQRKMEILEQSRQKKKAISDAFTQFRIILDKKEKELIENQTKSEQEFMKFLEMDFNLIAQKLGVFTTDIDTMAQQINQKDQVYNQQIIMIKDFFIKFFR